MKKIVFAAAVAMVALTGSAMAANENSSCQSQVNAAIKEAFGTPGQNEIPVRGKVRPGEPTTTSIPANEFAAARNEFREKVCSQEDAPKKLPN